MSAGRRKYLPAEGYRFLVLALLAARGEAGATKGDIAWETRANHYMTTRVLRDLATDKLVGVSGDAASGFAIRITPAGRTFLDDHARYVLRIHSRLLQAHFRFAPIPAWLQDVGRNARTRR